MGKERRLPTEHPEHAEGKRRRKNTLFLFSVYSVCSVGSSLMDRMDSMDLMDEVVALFFFHPCHLWATLYLGIGRWVGYGL